MDTKLQEAGIQLGEIESRLDGQGKVLIITPTELAFADENGVQHAPLRQVTKVAIDKTGSLSVRSATGDLIAGNIRGFDLTALKFFLEGAKSSIARAKTSARTPTVTEPAPFVPTPIASPAPAPEPVHTRASDLIEPPVQTHAAQLADDDWGSDPAHRQPTFDTWSTVRDSDMNTKSSSDMHKSFEIAPDDDAPRHDQTDKAGLQWGEDAIPTHDDQAQVATTQIHVPSDSQLGATDVQSEVHEWNQNFNLVGANPSKPEIAAQAAPVLEGASDWSGEILEASSSLSTNVPAQVQPMTSPGNAISPSKDPTPTIDRPMSIANIPNLAPIARWLRILSPLMILLGVACAALQFPANFETDSSHLLQLVIAISSFFVGLVLALIAYGLAELLSAWGSLAADVRSLKRNSMGH
jgi:hypothetical protein